MDADLAPFRTLFQDACEKSFSKAFVAPLSESESHRLSVDIEESTGLEIGWKSLKNYSNYLMGRSGRTENPSVPTLDTLARYVAGAPATTEERRRTNERHYPYWFRYRDSLRTDGLRSAEPEPVEDVPTSADVDGIPLPGSVARFTKRNVFVGVAALVAVLLVLLVVTVRQRQASSTQFVDEFTDVSDSALAARGWSVQSVEPAHWNQRGGRPDHLTLFTLTGDNWPQLGTVPAIRNLLVRRIESDCFVAEVRLTAFFPTQNWQQAGILLIEDTAFAGRSARLSIGYNDFSGGFPQTREVIVQGITSLGRESSKPEEIVHHRLFVVDSATEPLVRQNLESSGLRIEKRGAHLRLLYSAGPLKNAPFKEAAVAEFDFKPAYVAVFALKGFATPSADASAYVDAFSVSKTSCSP